MGQSERERGGGEGGREKKETLYKYCITKNFRESHKSNFSRKSFSYVVYNIYGPTFLHLLAKAESP